MMVELGSKLSPAQVLDHLGSVARGIVEGGQEHAAMLHILHGDEEGGYLPHGVAIVEIPESDEDRDCMVAGIHALLDQQEADAYVFINESWMVKVSTKDQALAIPRPSEHPDREEYLILHFVNREGHGLVHSYRINTCGAKRTLGPREQSMQENFRGRMTNFFERRGIHATEKGH